MFNFFFILTVGVYITSLVCIAVYCIFQFQLLIYYKGSGPKSEEEFGPDSADEDYPFVTIQLPLYNEYFVVERLIDNITKLDYPKDRFEIHILDDSTDDTLELSQNKVDEYKAQGFNIELVVREKRKGYKAGALKDAMHRVNGEFIAIFDADFLPEPDFLKKTIPHFKNPEIGVVQTRWGHINQSYSLLTEVQAFQLNVHFTVEQEGRNKGGLLLQFNGTAGVWRKETIDDAGGWEADTLTEDLDLSYRAQLKGWKIVFLEDVLSPAELPDYMNGLKSQQHRWMKGGAETAKKLLPKIWSSDISLKRKMHGTIHLLGSTVFLSVFLVGVFSVPLLYFIRTIETEYSILSYFLLSTILIALVYFVANVQTAWDSENKLKSIIKFIFLFPIFLSLSMGLSFHNSLAVIQGYLGRKSPFVRTPKFNIQTDKDALSNKKYKGINISRTTIIEGLLTCYFLSAVVVGLLTHNSSLVIFHCLLTFGYGTIFFYSVKHLRHQA